MRLWDDAVVPVVEVPAGAVEVEDVVVDVEEVFGGEVVVCVEVEVDDDVDTVTGVVDVEEFADVEVVDVGLLLAVLVSGTETAGPLVKR
jgi:hypothetical protein